MYKEDLVLNNLQGLICHKTQPNQAYKPFSLSLCTHIQFKNFIKRLFLSMLKTMPTYIYPLLFLE